MPDLVDMSESMSETVILHRWALSGQAATLAELRANYAPGQDGHAYLVGKDVHTWDMDAADFLLVGQWQGPAGPSGPGVAAGGATGQLLIKSSSGDFETAWVDLTLETTAPLSGGGRVVDGLTLNIADATETKRGVVRIANYSETATGSHDNLAVSPVRLKEQLDTIRADIAAINSMPVGTIFMFAAATPPEGALVGNGAIVPIADFPGLFSVVGYAHTPEGETPPLGYFYLPNYMDMFLRGHNPASGRKFGSEQEDAIRNIVGTVSTASFSTNTSARGRVYTSGAFIATRDASLTTVYISSGANTAGDTTTANTATLDVSTAVPTADENRPVNKTVLICIKY